MTLRPRKRCTDLRSSHSVLLEVAIHGIRQSQSKGILDRLVNSLGLLTERLRESSALPLSKASISQCGGLINGSSAVRSGVHRLRRSSLLRTPLQVSISCFRSTCWTRIRGSSGRRRTRSGYRTWNTASSRGIGRPKRFKS